MQGICTCRAAGRDLDSGVSAGGHNPACNDWRRTGRRLRFCANGQVLQGFAQHHMCSIVRDRLDNMCHFSVSIFESFQFFNLIFNGCTFECPIMIRLSSTYRSILSTALRVSIASCTQHYHSVQWASGMCGCVDMPFLFSSNGWRPFLKVTFG